MFARTSITSALIISINFWDYFRVVWITIIFSTRLSHCDFIVLNYSRQYDDKLLLVERIKVKITILFTQIAILAEIWISDVIWQCLHKLSLFRTICVLIYINIEYQCYECFGRHKIIILILHILHANVRFLSVLFQRYSM